MNRKTVSQKPVAIVGAHGYSGLQLARLLLKHPGAKLKSCFARNADWRLVNEIGDEGADQVVTLPISELVGRQDEYDTVFLATPAEASMELVRDLRIKSSSSTPSPTKIIDLSGAFRLPASTFESGYGMSHTAQDALSDSVYGLVPWIKTDSASLVANPGCYATSVLMAIIPLLKAGLIQPSTLVIDAKSGTTGAGRKAQEKQLFAEIDGNYFPYRVGTHQHFPEIIRYASALSGVSIDPFFTTSLIPVRRGIMSSIYGRLESRMASSGEGHALGAVEAAFSSAYANYPLVRVRRLGISEAQDGGILSLKKVVGSARTHIGFQVKGDKLFVFSAIDNLMKGAASQALENWNTIQGWEAHLGLLGEEGLI